MLPAKGSGVGDALKPNHCPGGSTGSEPHLSFCCVLCSVLGIGFEFRLQAVAHQEDQYVQMLFRFLTASFHIA